MNQIIRTILAEWKERKLPNIVKRDIELDIISDKKVRNAYVVTGFRRVGKTYVVFETINRLIKKYSREEVIYINFEDERIINPSTNFLTDLIPEIESFFGKKPKYLFLDELQVVPNWSKWVRRILDTESIEIVITGSSSKMGSSELPSELRGRAWEIKIDPLNFSEFLRFKETVSQDKSKFDFMFNEYLGLGGLPAVVLTTEDKKQELLQSYFRTVVQKEIIERYKINNENVLKTLLKLLLNSNYITISKLSNSLKSLSIPVGKTTIDKYISYIKSSYFMDELKYFSPKVINQLNYPRKTYFIDNGFITSLSIKFSKNMGRLFENITFQKLAKENENIYYWKDEKGREVDFVVMEEGKVKQLYQACYDVSDEETLKREVKSLTRAGKVLNCSDLNLIVFNKPDNFNEIDKIKIISAQEFFSGEKEVNNF